MPIIRLFFCLIVLPCWTQAQTPVEPKAETKAEPTGVLSGRVLADGQPVANAVVTASSALRTTLSRSATTDEEGAFQITGLATAAYDLRAVLPGYILLPQLDSAGERQRFRVGASVTLNLTKGGAITGKVFNPSGEPIAGLSVVALRVRDEAGRLSNYDTFARRTDDRGVYRIFGLPPGSYLVYTNGKEFGWSWNADEQANDAPTYHPSSTRDTAAELKLGSGEELSGIDIRHRSERGHRISGKVVGALNGFGVVLSLKQSSTGEVATTDWRSLGQRNPNAPVTFEMRAVADGEYDLVAEIKNGNEDGAASLPRRVTVNGADVTGLELRLNPLAAVTGIVRLDESKTAPTCEQYKPSSLEEIALSLRPDPPPPRPSNLASTTPSRTGEFQFRFVDPARYRFHWQLPNPHWYVRSLTIPPDPRTKKATDLALTGLPVSAGEKPTALLTLATDAAELRGKLAAAATNIKVHLIPAEPEASANVLRYAETNPASDGTFAFTHLSPGKYWLLARSVAATTDERPTAWDSAERAKLRRAAEATNRVLELKPCQRVTEYLVK